MLRFIDQLIDTPIVGIRGGRRLSSVIEPIINPHKMAIEAFYCDDKVVDSDMVMFTSDIREIGRMGIIVDSEDVIMPMADLVRLEEIANINFQLIGKNVINESGKKLGKVENYTIDDLNFRIEKIYARPTAIKALSSNDFIISRRQVVSVNNNEVIVKDATNKRRQGNRRPSLNPQT